MDQIVSRWRLRLSGFDEFRNAGLAFRRVSRYVSGVDKLQERKAVSPGRTAAQQAEFEASLRKLATPVAIPDYAERRRRNFGGRVFPNFVLQERETA